MIGKRLTGLMTILLCLPLMAARGHGLRFTQGDSSLCIPFDGSNRHIAFQGRLNERDGMRIVLDTGAGGSVIDATRAAELGLEKRGEAHALGAGGAEQGILVGGVDVQIPGVQLVDQHMSALPLAALGAQSGRKLDGILGHPVFAQSVVEVDYAKQCVSLFNPSSYRYKGSGVSVPLTFIDNTPYVEARVELPDGRALKGKFLIDTGASTSLALSPGFVEQEAVLASLGKTMAMQARGVGGPTDVRLARVGKLELAGFSLAQPVAALQPKGAGIISAEGTAGNIGGGVLSRFKVIFDYPKRRMILEPGPDIDLPFETDMSGLGLVASGADLSQINVTRVLDGSPALEAGVRAGDEIESVNGKPVAEVGLIALREQLRREGQDVKLTLKRGHERITLGLKTRRMI
jgi:predicted aspartyl protease